MFTPYSMDCEVIYLRCRYDCHILHMQALRHIGVKQLNPGKWQVHDLSPSHGPTVFATILRVDVFITVSASSPLDWGRHGHWDVYNFSLSCYYLRLPLLRGRLLWWTLASRINQETSSPTWIKAQTHAFSRCSQLSSVSLVITAHPTSRRRGERKMHPDITGSTQGKGALMGAKTSQRGD